MREIHLIEAPSNLGLSEPSPGREPGVRLFPSAMEKEHFSTRLNAAAVWHLDVPRYSGIVDAKTGVRNTPEIISFSRQLSCRVQHCISDNVLPVVLGGDCSVLIGSALALKQLGEFGLLFLDGHTDYVLPEQSGTAGAAGMDLAICTGNGHTDLTNIDGMGPYFREENVFCCGNRELSEDWYVAAILQSDIHYFDLPAVRDKRPSQIAQQFLQLVAQKKLDGFWVHLDVDVLDDALMPCVDSRQPGGLSYKELKHILTPLKASTQFAGIDITIFDPTLDPEGVYGAWLARHLSAILQSAR